MAGELSGAELDAQSTPMGPETNPATGESVSGKTLTQSSDGVSKQNGALYPTGTITQYATEDLISSNYAEQKNQNLSGVNTLDTRLDDTSMS
jgi:hypothetical protein